MIQSFLQEHYLVPRVERDGGKIVGKRNFLFLCYASLFQDMSNLHLYRKPENSEKA